MYDTTFEPSGFSQYAAISTGMDGQMEGTVADNAVTQGPDTSGLCTLCSNPTTRPIIFGVGALLIVLAWHFHIFSMVE